MDVDHVHDLGVAIESLLPIRVGRVGRLDGRVAEWVRGEREVVVAGLRGVVSDPTPHEVGETLGEHLRRGLVGLQRGHRLPVRGDGRIAQRWWLLLTGYRLVGDDWGDVRIGVQLVELIGVDAPPRSTRDRGR